jgi:mannosyltransferase
MCVIPAVSRTAQEARPYALAILIVSAATLLLVRALRAPSRRTWIWYGVALAACGYVHLFAFSAVLGHAAAVAALTRLRTRGWWLAASGAALAVAPLAVAGTTQRKQVAYLPLTTPDLLFDYPERLLGGGAVAGGILVLGVLSAARERWTAWVAGTLAVVPALALAAAGAVVHLFTVRYALFTMAGWAVLAGTGLAATTRPTRMVALVCAAMFGFPAQQAIRDPSGHFDHGARAATREVIARQAAGDGIAYEDVSWLRVAMDYHLPTASRPPDVLLTRPARDNGGYVATECAAPATCLTGVTRLWVVHQDTDHPLQRMTPAKIAAIRDHYVPTTSHRHGSVTLTLYVHRPPPKLHE